MFTCFYNTKTSIKNWRLYSFLMRLSPWALEWKHIYASAYRQSQVPAVNTLPPSTFWPYLRNIAFLTGTTEKISWSSILRIQSTYHSCKPKNTQWPNPLLHSYKMWKRKLKSQISNIIYNSPDSSLKNRTYFSLSIDSTH